MLLIQYCHHPWCMFLSIGLIVLAYSTDVYSKQDVFQRTLLDLETISTIGCGETAERLQIITTSYVGFAPNCSHVNGFKKHHASPNCAVTELESFVQDACNEKGHCSVPEEIIGKLCNDTNLELNVIYQCIGFVYNEQAKVKIANLRKEPELTCSDYNKRIAIVSIFSRGHLSNCRALLTESSVKKICDGRKSCTIGGSRVMLKIFHRDQCFRPNKLLEVIFTCLAAD